MNLSFVLKAETYLAMVKIYRAGYDRADQKDVPFLCYIQNPWILESA